MDAGSRVAITPNEYHAMPEGFVGLGTVRAVEPAEILPVSMFFVELDGLPEWKWDWFFIEELAPLSAPSSRIGDTDLSDLTGVPRESPL